MSGKVLMECKNLKTYFNTPHGKLHAVDDISIQIEEGKTLGVVGESGCGKSTLGRTLIGLTEATSGEVYFDGKDITNMSTKEFKYLRRQMQIIFQDPYSSVDPKKTIFDIIAEPLRIQKLCKTKKELSEKVEALMEEVGLDLRYVNTYPHELDGGRRQRVVVARALAMNPKFIVCDEPVSALDVSIQAQILNLLMDLKDSNNLTYMFITHDLSVVKHISDDIMVLYMGRVVEYASSDELFENPKHPYTEALLEAIPVPDLKYLRAGGETLIGEVSSPINPPTCCRFAKRCPRATERCFNEEPGIYDVGGGHKVSCIMYES